MQPFMIIIYENDIFHTRFHSNKKQRQKKRIHQQDASNIFFPLRSLFCFFFSFCRFPFFSLINLYTKATTSKVYLQDVVISTTKKTIHSINILLILIKLYFFLYFPLFLSRRYNYVGIVVTFSSFFLFLFGKMCYVNDKEVKKTIHSAVAVINVYVL